MLRLKAIAANLVQSHKLTCNLPDTIFTEGEDYEKEYLVHYGRHNADHHLGDHNYTGMCAQRINY